ncbi:MAG TPA: L-lactate dehydrogenase, partial [Halanaerobiales bacterium]|nr:L-lactate dehydrogenase [Halanaerobiales bacterium]
GHNSRDFMDEISGKVRNSAYEIIEKKGATYYAVGLAVARIVESIFRDENTILTVSTVLEGQYGLKGLALSLPAIVGHGGAEKILDLKLSEEEEKELVESGEILKGILQGLKI